MSTHALEQIDFCASSQAHAELEQWELAGHAAPHEPQLAPSARKSTHVPALSQYVRPNTLHWQCPAEQVSPLRQATSHPPQFLTSDCTSMHLPAEAQYFCPNEGHPHAPLVQPSVGAQAWPHVPQLATSASRFTHAEAASHHVCPVGHPHIP
jgi:hypothetical protein